MLRPIGTKIRISQRLFQQKNSVLASSMDPRPLKGSRRRHQRLPFRGRGSPKRDSIQTFRWLNPVVMPIFVPMGRVSDPPLRRTTRLSCVTSVLNFQNRRAHRSITQSARVRRRPAPAPHRGSPSRCRFGGCESGTIHCPCCGPQSGPVRRLPGCR